MKLKGALEKLGPIRGMTSLIAASLSGDFKPVTGTQGEPDIDLLAAKQKLKEYEVAQRNATSDWSYWGYQGDVSYWRTVVSILEAAALVGEDDLPDVEGPKSSGILMDDCALQEEWGTEILKRAKAMVGPDHQSGER